MHYAIHGWLTEEFLKNKLSLDVADSIDDLNTSINNMSKFTHINVETFNIPGATKTMESLGMLSDLLRFLMDIEEWKGKVRNAIITDFSERIGNSFSIETFDDIDILSTHSSIEDFGIEGYTLKELGETIEVEAYGHVHTRLQIGSNSDLLRDDGFVTYMDFPFTATCVADIHNVSGDIKYSDPEILIDTDKYFHWSFLLSITPTKHRHERCFSFCIVWHNIFRFGRECTWATRKERGKQHKYQLKYQNIPYQNQNFISISRKIIVSL